MRREGWYLSASRWSPGQIMLRAGKSGQCVAKMPQKGWRRPVTFQKSGGSVLNGFKWPRQNGIAAHYEIIPQVSMSFDPTNMEWPSSLRVKHCDRSFFWSVWTLVLAAESTPWHSWWVPEDLCSLFRLKCRIKHLAKPVEGQREQGTMVVEAAASDAAVVTGSRATWRHSGRVGIL